MKRMIVPLLLVVLASARIATAQSLGNVGLDFLATLGPQVTINYSENYVPGPATYTTESPHAGPYEFSLSPGTTPSALAAPIGPLYGFCIDLVQDIGNGNYPTGFQLYSVTASQNTGLLDVLNGVTSANATVNVLKLFTEYSGAGGSLNLPVAGDLSTALTLAIWDVLIDPNAGVSTHIDISSPTNPLYESGPYPANATAVADANAWLNGLPAATPYAGNFYAAVSGTGAQAQEFISLNPLPLSPEPPVSAGLFGLALLGVPYFFRGRRKATGNA